MGGEIAPKVKKAVWVAKLCYKVCLGRSYHSKFSLSMGLRSLMSR